MYASSNFFFLSIRRNDDAGRSVIGVLRDFRHSGIPLGNGRSSEETRRSVETVSTVACKSVVFVGSSIPTSDGNDNESWLQSMEGLVLRSQGRPSTIEADG